MQVFPSFPRSGLNQHSPLHVGGWESADHFIITNQGDVLCHTLSDCSREAFAHLSCTPRLSSCTAIMSNQSFGVAKDGSRPQSAFPNTPSWLPTSAVAKPPPPPPPPVTTESQPAEQVSVPTRPCASITCTVGRLLELTLRIFKILIVSVCRFFSKRIWHLCAWPLRQQHHL